MSVSTPINVTRFVQGSRFSGLQKRVILICLLLGISDGFNSLCVGYAIPSLSKAWEVTPGSFAMVITAAVIGEIIASVTLAPLADRFGRKAVITFGVALFALATVAAAFSGAIGALIALRFIAGLGMGSVTPNLFALGSEYAPGKFTATALTIIGTGMAGGGAICGLVATYVVPQFGGLALLFVSGAVPLVFLLLSLPMLPNSIEHYARRGDNRRVAKILNKIEGGNTFSETDTFTTASGNGPAKPTPAELFRNGRAASTLLVWFMLLLGLASCYFVFSWLVTILVSAGVELPTAILATSITTFGGMLGGILFGILMDRTRLGVGTLLVGVILQIVVTVILATIAGEGAPEGLVVTLCFLLGFGIIGTSLALSALVAQTYSQSLRGTGIGWATGFSRLGAIGAPLLGGLFIDSGFTAAAMLYSSLVMPVLLGILLLVFIKIGKTATEYEAIPDVEAREADAVLQD